MRGSGGMTCSMARERRCGLMGRSMKGSINRGRSMDMEYTAGMMDRCMMESGARTKSRVKGLIHGWMGGNSKENG